jgi:N-acyl-phosphatidylethanolamine-hydrolysing phospholipase D
VRHRAPHAVHRGLALLLCATGLAVGAQERTATDGPPHGAPRQDGKFQNNYIAFEPKSLGELLKWRIEAAREGLPKPPQQPTPRVPADLDFLRANARAGAAMEPALTWIGHATVLAQVGGINVLIDPIFSERASPLGFIGPKRHAAPGLTVAELPHVDAVLVSHNHYDHLDDASVRALAAQAGGAPLFVVPLGIKAWLADRDITNVVELDWWQSARLGAVEIVLTPAQHWSSRSLGDRMSTLWGGFAVFAPDFQIFYPGDTGYSKDFADIHARFAARHGAGRGFDVALIPIGAYEPRWFMKEQHVDPGEAVQVHLDVAATRSIGVHWGTFELTDESLDEPPQALARARRERGVADDAFVVMAIGETRRFPRRAP